MLPSSHYQTGVGFERLEFLRLIGLSLPELESIVELDDCAIPSCNFANNFEEPIILTDPVSCWRATGNFPEKVDVGVAPFMAVDKEGRRVRLGRHVWVSDEEKSLISLEAYLVHLFEGGKTHDVEKLAVTARQRFGSIETSAESSVKRISRVLHEFERQYGLKNISIEIASEVTLTDLFRIPVPFSKMFVNSFIDVHCVQDSLNVRRINAVRTLLGLDESFVFVPADISNFYGSTFYYTPLFLKKGGNFSHYVVPNPMLFRDPNYGGCENCCSHRYSCYFPSEPELFDWPAVLKRKGERVDLLFSDYIAGDSIVLEERGGIFAVNNLLFISEKQNRRVEEVPQMGKHFPNRVNYGSFKRLSVAHDNPKEIVSQYHL